MPGAGARVLVRSGDVVTYDVSSSAVIRSIQVAGTLTFSRDCDTRLDVGLLKVQAGEHAGDNGVDCETHTVPPNAPLPTLEVGSPEAPIPAQYTALIRLTPVAGQDPTSCPSILSCGGRMEFHGAPMSRTWVKLGVTAPRGDREVDLQEPVTGWRPGDQVIVTTTALINFFVPRPGGGRLLPSILDGTQTEEARIVSVKGDDLVLDHPLKFEHFVEGRYRGEVANLSRNVIIESAEPDGVRGHTMYHYGSKGSISYAEFRHLGKKGVLARYPIHFHRVGDSMRGSSVVGASIWDSANRFIAVHGTDYLVIRDNVGYRSIGHGFFLEDGTEELNVLDRHLAVQAMLSDPLPGQALAADLNDGAGFWWANSLNSFTRNVAVVCSQYGFRYQLERTPKEPVEYEVRQNDGTTKLTDVRRLPFLRFEGNEAHSQRRFAFNLGGFNGLGDDRDVDRDGNVLDREKFLSGDVQGVGPDDRHPFVIRDFLAWRSQWGFHAGAPNVHVQGLDIYDVVYGIWRSNFAGHEYNNLDFHKVDTSSFFFGYGREGSRYEELRFLHLDDTQPPVTVITSVRRVSPDRVEVFGITADDNRVSAVTVNGELATLQPGLVTEWRALIPISGKTIAIEAASEDAAGNREQTPHRLVGSSQDLDALSSVAVVRTSTAAPALAEKPAYEYAMVRSETPVASGARELAAAKSVQLTSPAKWPLWNGKETVAAWAACAGLSPVRTIQLAGQPLEMVLIPPGRFVMGSPSDERGHSPDEGPPRAVLISRPFYLGRTEVTQAQYQAVMGTNPSKFRGPSLPVEQVSWLDAAAFLAKVGHGLRLPTEAEWEMACRAGTESTFASGPTTEGLARMAWFGQAAADLPGEGPNDGPGQTSPVGTRQPNAFGLYDMHGNVYEWVSDFYAPDFYASGSAIDPTGPKDANDRRERALRGGAWESNANLVRSANRNGYPEGSRGYTVGFRVAMPVE